MRENEMKAENHCREISENDVKREAESSSEAASSQKPLHVISSAVSCQPGMQWLSRLNNLGQWLCQRNVSQRIWP